MRTRSEREDRRLQAAVKTFAEAWLRATYPWHDREYEDFFRKSLHRSLERFDSYDKEQAQCRS